MKYVLSTGTTTTNLDLYMQDLIKINIILPLKSVPYSQIGLEHNIGSVNESEIQSEIFTNVADMVQRINPPVGCSVELKGVRLQGTKVLLDIQINGELSTYEISA